MFEQTRNSALPGDSFASESRQQRISTPNFSVNGLLSDAPPFDPVWELPGK
jgi:hypothetical protein